MSIPVVVKTLQALEPLLAEELRGLGVSNVEEGRRFVKGEVDEATLYRINYTSRLALRVLCPIQNFSIRNADDLYFKAMEFPWEDYLTPETTFAIDPQVYSDLFPHTHYPSMRLKDAIADRMRKHFGTRPNVDAKNPDVQLHLLIESERVQISLDSSGRSLNQRGYRVTGGQAPMNEVLAAGIVALANWQGDGPLYNPFCGSGTLAIEAGYRALNVPAQLLNPNFNFQTWCNFNLDLWEEIQDEENGKMKETEIEIIASDIDPDQLSIAKRNARDVPFFKHIQFRLTDFFAAKEEVVTPGMILMNPPYGERMEVEALDEIYKQLGSVFKHYYSGSEVWLISSDLGALNAIGLKPKKKVKAMNGKLECEIRGIELFRGKRSEFKQGQGGTD